MYKLYDFLPSGNCYKVRLLLTQLQIPFTRIEINILNQETRTPDFLAKNPNGRVPVLEISSNQYLAESNAILFYLSQNTNYFPSNTFEKAQVMQWLFFEQYSHEPNLATSRYWISILRKAAEYQEALQQKQVLGYAALNVMENHLKKQDFLVGNIYTIADIALYAYTHVAEEGGFDLTQFTAIQAWFKRVENQPKYLKINDI
ncbi:Glutathione S-transferase domain protein [Rippkaea orientalis PCC 8801]|uniref:Glutathione S-transferase domain protein n=1 Tax=Rippkaea orientalis (strain PCC 8801 / RF-1) TaxID=41431 RepID=B7K4I2_RIPO1|nr:glutathione S-transferase family protein [Rippkaea orientalis]ACK65447.1 Glutathione S-transferase domain protein [Rippkaea orientalis PCC 8801]